MARVCAYVRPVTLDEALACLDRPGAVVVGGGTKVNAARTQEPVAVIDLQGLHIDGIERVGERGVAIGSTATLQRLADSAIVPDPIREAARREEPSTLRALATVGGLVATADPSSELLATLLVHDGVVSLSGRDGLQDLELAALLADRTSLAGRIITSVRVETGGVTSVARTARTPADRAIVAAVARRTPDGQLRLALTGVAAVPVLVAPTPEAAAALDPPGDFRGSTEYRRVLARVLAGRALEGIG
jgi:CO/xanthine dehydrogenase FAD-binding subunit